jgi:hypothetical protein
MYVGGRVPVIESWFSKGLRKEVQGAKKFRLYAQQKCRLDISQAQKSDHQYSHHFHKKLMINGLQDHFSTFSLSKKIILHIFSCNILDFARNRNLFGQRGTRLFLPEKTRFRTGIISCYYEAKKGRLAA